MREKTVEAVHIKHLQSLVLTARVGLGPGRDIARRMAEPRLLWAWT